MPTGHTFQRVSNGVNLLPITAVDFYDGTNHLEFFYLEEESSLSLQSISLPHCKGGETSVGWRVEAKIIIPYNRLGSNLEGANPLTYLAPLRNKRPETRISTGSAGTTLVPSPTFPLIANTTDSLVWRFVRNLTLTFDIEQVPFRPRTTITLAGFLKDLLNVVEPGESGSAYKLFDTV